MGFKFVLCPRVLVKIRVTQNKGMIQSNRTVPIFISVILSHDECTHKSLRSLPNEARQVYLFIYEAFINNRL
jgi:hypothetical protein